MPKGYWVAFFREIYDADKMAAYTALARPAIAAAGGKMLARGVPTATYDAGIKERVVMVEFNSVTDAIACHDSSAYQEALKLFAGAAERDLRIIESVEE